MFFVSGPEKLDIVKVEDMYYIISVVNLHLIINSLQTVSVQTYIHIYSTL